MSGNDELPLSASSPVSSGNLLVPQTRSRSPTTASKIATSSPPLVRDPNDCVGCGCSSQRPGLVDSSAIDTHLASVAFSCASSALACNSDFNYSTSQGQQFPSAASVPVAPPVLLVNPCALGDFMCSLRKTHTYGGSGDCVLVSCVPHYVSDGFVADVLTFALGTVQSISSVPCTCGQRIVEFADARLATIATRYSASHPLVLAGAKFVMVKVQRDDSDDNLTRARQFVSAEQQQCGHASIPRFPRAVSILQQHPHTYPAQLAMQYPIAYPPRASSPVVDMRSTAARCPSFEIDPRAIANGVDLRSTVMIRNIPNKYTQELLLALLNVHLCGDFDFFYLPVDFTRGCNVGYAFVNCIDQRTILKLVDNFNAKRWPRFNSEKVCAIMYARIQGKRNLISHFQNSSLHFENREFRPLVFHSRGPHRGELMPFPLPAVMTECNDQRRLEIGRASLP